MLKNNFYCYWKYLLTKILKVSEFCYVYSCYSVMSSTVHCCPIATWISSGLQLEGSRSLMSSSKNSISSVLCSRSDTELMYRPDSDCMSRWPTGSASGYMRGSTSLRADPVLLAIFPFPYLSLIWVPKMFHWLTLTDHSLYLSVFFCTSSSTIKWTPQVSPVYTLQIKLDI